MVSKSYREAWYERIYFLRILMQLGMRSFKPTPSQGYLNVTPSYFHQFSHRFAQIYRMAADTFVPGSNNVAGINCVRR